MFDSCQIDTERRELRCADAVIDIEPQVFDLVVFMAVNPQRLITRDELIQAVWNGRIVSDATIDGRIASARKAIGDDGRQQRIIKTVPRRGFRFLADVQHKASGLILKGDALPPSGRGGAKSESSGPVIAVLPFGNQSQDAQPDYFAEGISEDITTVLSRFHALRVVSRMSSFQFREKDLAPSGIASQLNADYLLSGNVRRHGERIRIVVELYDGASGHVVWSERFDRLATDVFTVQDEIAQTVAAQMTGQVQLADLRRMLAKESQDLTAYDDLLAGLDLHKSGDIRPETAQQAVSAFSKAIEKDPAYARAYAWRACSFSRTWGYPVSTEEFEAVKTDVLRSLELDPGEAEAHRIAGAVFRALHEFDRADEHIEKALELNPSDAHILVKAAEHHAFLSRADEARSLVEQAMNLNPLFPAWYWEVLALASYVEGQFERATREVNRSTSPTFAGLAYLAAAQMHLNQNEDAKRTVAELRSKFPQINVAVYQREGCRFSFADEAIQGAFVDMLISAGVLPLKPLKVRSPPRAVVLSCIKA